MLLYPSFLQSVVLTVVCFFIATHHEGYSCLYSQSGKKGIFLKECDQSQKLNCWQKKLDVCRLANDSAETFWWVGVGKGWGKAAPIMNKEKMP